MVIWHQTYGKGHMIAREEPHCCHYMSDSFQLAARVLLFTSFHRQDSTYHGLCYTSRRAMAGIRNILMDPPWANALTTELQLTPIGNGDGCHTKGELFLIPASAPQLVQQRLWYVLACLLIGKSSLCDSSGFPLSLSELSFTMCLMPYN